MRIIFIVITLLFCLVFPNGYAQTANPVGDATALGGDCFRVTENASNQNGAVWYSEQLDLSEYFALTLEINLGTNDQFGADGIVFVMQQVGLDAIGENGGGMGFEGFEPSFGVEFDTFENGSADDLVADHMAMFRDGSIDHWAWTSLADPVPIIPGGGNAENGEPIIFKLVWDPILQEVKAFIDCELRMTANVDLVSEIFQNDPLVYWGFTGATGFYTNEQTVCFLEAEYLHPTEYLDVCLNDEVELSIATDLATDITWSPATGLDDVNSASPVFTATENITYVVEYNKCGEVFQDTTVVDVTILDIEDVDNQAICNGDETMFELEYDTSLAVNWSNASNADSSVYSEEGEHWVEVSDGVCTRRKYFELEIIPLPDIIAPSLVEYCYADSSLVEFSAENSELFLPDGTNGNQFYVSAEGTYEVTAQNIDYGCVNSDVIEVQELPLPEIDLEAVYEICPYETLELSLNPAYDVEWSTSAVSNDVSINDQGDYSVLAELNGCAQSHQFQLLVNPLPLTAVPGNYEFCEDTNFELSSDNTNYQFQWPNGEIAESFEFEEEGDYSIQVTNPETGCRIIGNVSLTMILNPTIEMDEQYFLCEGEEIEIKPAVENADDIVWSTGASGEEEVITAPGELIVTASNECKDVDFESTVESILCDCTAFVPLAFTPDGDGLNETFAPRLTCEPFEYEFAVYNRWGDVIFQSTDWTESWVGNSNSGDYYVLPGVYTYKLSYKSEQFDGIHAETKYGMVSVLR